MFSPSNGDAAEEFKRSCKKVQVEEGFSLRDAAKGGGELVPFPLPVFHIDLDLGPVLWLPTSNAALDRIGPFSHGHRHEESNTPHCWTWPCKLVWPLSIVAGGPSSIRAFPTTKWRPGFANRSSPEDHC